MGRKEGDKREFGLGGSRETAKEKGSSLALVNRRLQKVMGSEGQVAQMPIFLLVTKAWEGAQGGPVGCHLGFFPQAPSWAPGSKERANP